MSAGEALRDREPAAMVALIRLSSVGSVPLSRLLLSHSWLSCVRRPISVGTVPERDREEHCSVPRRDQADLGRDGAAELIVVEAAAR